VNKKTVVKIKICTFLQGILATIAGYARIFGSLTNEREREREREREKLENLYEAIVEMQSNKGGCKGRVGHQSSDNSVGHNRFSKRATTQVIVHAQTICSKSITTNKYYNLHGQ
jgi:hypothetical protein